jgi:hypothetical protein
LPWHYMRLGRAGKKKEDGRFRGPGGEGGRGSRRKRVEKRGVLSENLQFSQPSLPLANPEYGHGSN